MAEVETLTVKVNYDMQEVKDALRTERMWYLEAFKKIEREFSDPFEYDAGKVFAMNMCRDRIRALVEELGDAKD